MLQLFTTGCKTDAAAAESGAETSGYKKVAFGTNGDGLKDYLKDAVPAADGICYIEVTGLTAADLIRNELLWTETECARRNIKR